MDLVGLKLRSDLVDWATKAGANLVHKYGEWRGACPLHGGDNDSAFVIYEEAGEQKWKCWTGPCGQGDIYDFIQRQYDCSLKIAYMILGGDLNPDPVKVTQAAIEKAERAEKALADQIEQAQRTLEELRSARRWLMYHDELLRNKEAARLWVGRGIRSDWQEFWKLGYCPDFSNLNTPTLTIPIFDDQWQVINLRHRLLNPPKPNDKYRPDRPGLRATPFIGNPNIGYNCERVLVVEGEIKAMVTYETLFKDEATTPQVIGIPGKSQFHSLIPTLSGKEVYICFDPDAEKEAHDAAAAVKGKIITLPVKIDDAILAHDLNAKTLAWRMATARRV